MTRVADIGRAGAVPGAPFALAPAGATAAGDVPASFDCAKAGSMVEKLVCAHAVLRRQDLALSRSHAARLPQSEKGG